MTNEEMQSEKENLMDELKEMLRFQKRSGFYSNERCLETAIEYRDDNYDEELVTVDWIRELIQQLDAEIDMNSEQADYKRLDHVFHELRMVGIVALHNAGYTQSDGISDCNEVADKLMKRGIESIGYCFYHEQDLERIVGTEGGKLYLAFGNYTDSRSAVEIGEIIVWALNIEGFEVEWNHSADKRIAILNMHWDKIYTKEAEM